MAATEEMVEIARKVRPHAACVVPERRAERTTEGGLDAAGSARCCAVRWRSSGTPAFAFRCSCRGTGADRSGACGRRAVIEIHTGAWCDTLAAGDDAAAAAEFAKITRGASLAAGAGLEVHAGHGLDFTTAEQIAALGVIAELNIGHFLIGEAVFGGLAVAVRRMREAMERGRRARMEPDRDSRYWFDIADVRRIADVIERHGEPFPPAGVHAAGTGQGGQTPESRGDVRQAIRRQGGLRQGAGNRAPRRRLVARHGVVQSAVRPSDHAADRWRQTTPRCHHAPGFEAQIDLTITDEGPMAQAFVIISASS